jgi:hypothetical protein
MNLHHPGLPWTIHHGTKNTTLIPQHIIDKYLGTILVVSPFPVSESLSKLVALLNRVIPPPMYVYICYNHDSCHESYTNENALDWIG